MFRIRRDLTPVIAADRGSTPLRGLLGGPAVPLIGARNLALEAIAIAAGALAGCADSAVTALGPIWFAGGPPPQAGGWMTWSADGATLFWVDRDEARQTSALFSMTQANGPVSRSLSDVDGFPSPQIVNGDRTIFFTRWQGDSAILLRASLAGGVAGEPVEVAREVFRYLASPDGQRVAIISTSAPGLTLALDVGTAASVRLGKFFEPTAFSPDGSRLLMRNSGANDPSEHYALVDPATGASENIFYPDGDSIDAVLRWDGNRPRVVVDDLGVTTDFATGVTGGIGLRTFVALSGDPAAPDHAYTWMWDCLGPYQGPPEIVGAGTTTNFRDPALPPSGRAAFLGSSVSGSRLHASAWQSEDFAHRIIFVGESLDRVTVNPAQCGGRPCVRGMRIRVVDVLDLLATGLTQEQVLAELPDLEAEDIAACLRFASGRLDHPILAA
jgi:uncharacterized protein (DUF433 family)